jgi:hypothetical protein
MPPTRGRPSSPNRGSIVLDVDRIEQPDNQTCGPTCLDMIYQHYGRPRPLEEVIGAVRRNQNGGTQAVYLGIAALRHGYRVIIYSYNLRIFDPTWSRLAPGDLMAKLEARASLVDSARLRRTLHGYVELLGLGGRVKLRDLDRALLGGILRRGHPILAGLSATYLYGTPREVDDRYDDVGGDPAGHFVVISGYYPRSDRFLVRDPSRQIPFSRTGRYTVGGDRLIASILLGDVTYDAVLVELWPA